MRVRRSAFLLGGAALVALLGAAAPAFAVTDPSCDGSPYNNDSVIRDFRIATPDSRVAYQVSGIEGSGLACGTNIWFPNGGQGTIYDHANIEVAPGVEINGTAGIASGRFVGTSVVNVATHVAGFPVVLEDNASVLKIGQISACENENPVGGDIPGTIIACYRGENPLGYNLNWATVDPNGDRWLTIGPFHPLTGIAGLTHIKQFNLCDYVGVVGGSQYPADCGDSSQPWMQRNGDSVLRLPQGGPIGIHGPCLDLSKGIYAVTATMRNGTTTAAATARVKWAPPSGWIPGNHPQCPPAARATK